MKPRKPEASLPDCMKIMYAICDAVWEMGLAKSRGQEKGLCIQGTIAVNGKQERDPWRSVCRFDEITKGG